MKHLKKFENEEAKNAWVNGSEYAAPNVALTEGVVEYNLFSHGYATLPLYFEAIDSYSLTIKFNRQYEYSRDNSTWSSGTKDTSISVKAGERVYFRASGLKPQSNAGIGHFSTSGKCKVGGNVLSMAYGADFKGKYVIQNAYQFYCLFLSCAGIVDASELALCATTLSDYCYSAMFNHCSNLVEPPKLPAKVLTESCYNGMFQDCTSLVNAPELPATTLVKKCYAYMFSGCTSLVNAPELPATELAEECCFCMFKNCWKLVNAPKLPATTLAHQCYAQMFQSCSSLIDAPMLPATTLADSCYMMMFYDCRGLIVAPELPAITLEYHCYVDMFHGCSKLNYIKMLATDISAEDCLRGWVDGVASSGTFVKNAAATWNVTGTSGIPEGWTKEYAES
jgi:hypothetical protein